MSEFRRTSLNEWVNVILLWSRDYYPDLHPDNLRWGSQGHGQGVAEKNPRYDLDHVCNRGWVWPHTQSMWGSHAKRTVRLKLSVVRFCRKRENLGKGSLGQGQGVEAETDIRRSFWPTLIWLQALLLCHYVTVRYKLDPFCFPETTLELAWRLKPWPGARSQDLDFGKPGLHCTGRLKENSSLTLTKAQSKKRGLTDHHLSVPIHQVGFHL